MGYVSRIPGGGTIEVVYHVAPHFRLLESILPSRSCVQSKHPQPKSGPLLSGLGPRHIPQAASGKRQRLHGWSWRSVFHQRIIPRVVTRACNR
jgi:hypothetical protein